MKKTLLIFCAVLFSSITAAGNQQQEEKAVKKVINTAYIEGLQNMGDMEQVRQGFHPEFKMLINQNGKLSKLPISTWIENVEQRKQNPAYQNHQRIKGEFAQVDITGDAAMVKLEVYREDQLLFTDYLTLYKMDGDWKIVGKTFHRH